MKDNLPYSLAEEMAVLGCAFVRPDLAAVVGALSPGFFHDPTHRKIFQEISASLSRGFMPDPIQVGAAIGNVTYVATLSDSLPVYPELDQYVRDLRALRQRREIHALGQEMALQALQGAQEPEDLLGLLRGRMEKIEALEGVNRVGRFGEAIPGILSNLGKGKYLSTGYSDLDLYIHGLEEGQLVIVAGRPGQGKSLFAQGVYSHVAKSEEVAAVFSLEMSKQELGMRILSSEATVPFKAIRSGHLSVFDRKALQDAGDRISHWPLYIDDRANLRVEDIGSACHAIKRQAGSLSLLVVDYLGLITPRRGVENRNVEVSEITRSLKTLAKDLRVPIVALHQLNRLPERRANHPEPMLTDLRDSGAVEQDADIVLFVYRPATDEGTSDDGKLIIAKHRNGETGWVPIRAQFNCMRFLTVDRDHA